MASSGKKKGKKGVTLSLNSFLCSEPGSGGGSSSSGGGGGGSRGGGSRGGGSSGHGSSGYSSQRSWADEIDDHDDGGDDGYSYGTPLKSQIDRSLLPTAPRAARDPDVDMSKVPTEPPYKAYLGNLPYDITPEDIEHFFGKLRVIDVSLPQDQGRQKGFGYAEFEDRQALVDALSMNDESLRNRKIRIDLAVQTQDRERDGFRRRDDGDDRTSGDWRKKDDRPSTFGRRDDDRGFDRRDRFDDRDRYDCDRDSGFGRDRYSNRDSYRDSYDRDSQRDRGFSRGGDRGGDRFDDRRRYDDRGGFDRDRDGGRRFGSGYRDGDRGGDRGFGRDGDRGNRYEPPRDRGYDRGSYRDDRGPPPPRDDYDRGSREPSHESGKERPKLNLQKRSKPMEDSGKPSERTASIFGSAKPVDTAAKEREIEDRLRRQRENEQRQVDDEKENRERLTSTTSQRSRKESSGSQDGSTSRRERKLSSSSSGKGIRTVAPPPGVGSARVRRDSTLSDEEVFQEERDTKPSSQPTAQSPPKRKEEKVLVPAPPPKENIWEKRKTSGPSDDVPKPSESPRNNEQQHETINADNSRVQPENDSPKTKEFVPAEPPKENIWEKRKMENKTEKSSDGFQGSHWGSSRGRGSADRGHLGRGRGGTDGGHKREKREKVIPTSLDEMPKYEESKTKDFSEANKFSFLMDEEEETGNVSDK